jgi:C-terminal processing protease CtpA/Prc
MKMLSENSACDIFVDLDTEGHSNLLGVALAAHLRLRRFISTTALTGYLDGPLGPGRRVRWGENSSRSMLLATEGLGPQPFHGRIVLLVNEFTHSAAEMVASFARENNLATLVGTTTAGEVLGGANFKLASGYRLRMPVAGWYTWSDDCIEGKGIAPHVRSEILPNALAMGTDHQLSKAIEVVRRVSDR